MNNSTRISCLCISLSTLACGPSTEPNAITFTDNGSGTTTDDIGESESESGSDGSSESEDGADASDDTTSETDDGTADPECGNGVVEDGEGCDDGNMNDADECTNACELASCGDGILNGTETDLDCGGDCGPCADGAVCGESSDCATSVCIDDICQYAGSCLEIHELTATEDDGLYTIDVDGLDEGEPFEVFCNMSVDGGGWTLLQRTVWGPVETVALLTNYFDWYNSEIGSPAPGKGYRMPGKLWEGFNAERDHLLAHSMRKAFNGSDCNPLYYKGTNGVFSISEDSANLYDIDVPVQELFNYSPTLSTTNSGPSLACVTDSEGAPWFYEDCCWTCPTYRGSYWTERHPMMSYSLTPDMFDNTRLDACEGAEAELTLHGPGTQFRGVNVMEYYTR